MKQIINSFIRHKILLDTHEKSSRVYAPMSGSNSERDIIKHTVIPV